jgi:catechol 2,3-dioxygenase-like lactoylglutathione lyase family enzyme
MRFRAMSHVAIGVSDMARSVRFYRDVLGLRVTLDDPAENPDGMLQTTVGADRGQSRHAVYLRWEDGPDATFIVLSEYRPPVGQAIELDHIGISHVSFWVDDLDGVRDRLVAARVPIFVAPHVGDTVGYGEPPGGKVLTILFRDPDGILLQLDQRLS